MLLFLESPTGIIILVVAIAVIALIILLICSYVKAPPDTAYIITGYRKQRVLIGKAGFRIPGLERVDRIPLSLIQVDIKTASAVPTKELAPVIRTCFIFAPFYKSLPFRLPRCSCRP